ncbi:hypothetical protein Hanom_Chr06g00570161 [Helianthus anomalus]
MKDFDLKFAIEMKCGLSKQKQAFINVLDDGASKRKGIRVFIELRHLGLKQMGSPPRVLNLSQNELFLFSSDASFRPADLQTCKCMIPVTIIFTYSYSNQSNPYWFPLLFSFAATCSSDNGR